MVFINLNVGGHGLSFTYECIGGDDKWNDDRICNGILSFAPEIDRSGDSGLDVPKLVEKEPTPTSKPQKSSHNAQNDPKGVQKRAKSDTE